MDFFRNKISKNIGLTTLMIASQTKMEEEVLTGLRQPLKQISSKYFYDAEGDRLFQRIMQLDEYYLPECEKEIIENHSAAIAQNIAHKAFSIVELGAGDGSKTKRMLELFLSAGKSITYRPLDISADVLRQNQSLMTEHLPQLKVEPEAGDYMQSLPKISTQYDAKLVCFMGSNLGNYKQEKAYNFLKWIAENLSSKDYFLLAQDLKKHPKKILAAYNDAQGVTAAFNKNALKRFNRELGANFDLEAFEHFPTYNPETGICASYLISLRQQKVRFGNGETIEFFQNEPIHTEVSQKYSLEELQHLTQSSGLRQIAFYTDYKKHYGIGLYQKA